MMKKKTMLGQLFAGMMFFGLVCSISSAQTNGQTSNDPFPEHPVATTPGSSADPQSICVIPKIDGDKVPFPLKAANTKFELAENETYLLNGTIVSQDGKVLFKLDFNSQPWLATNKRAQFPYFLVDATETIVRKFNGSLVQMAVVVRKNEVQSGGQELNNGLMLNVIATPVIIRR